MRDSTSQRAAWIVRNPLAAAVAMVAILVAFAACGGGNGSGHVAPMVAASPAGLPLPTGAGTLLSPPPAPTGSALTSLLSGGSAATGYLNALGALTIVATQKVSEVGIVGHVVGTSASGFTVQPLVTTPTASSAAPALVTMQYPTVPSSAQPVSVTTTGSTVFDVAGGQLNVRPGMVVAVGGIMEGATLAAALVASMQFSTNYAAAALERSSRTFGTSAKKPAAAAASARAASSSASETAMSTIAFVAGTPFSGVNWESPLVAIGSSETLKTSVFVQFQVISGFGLAADWPVALTASAEFSPIRAGDQDQFRIDASPLPMSGPNPINPLSFGSFSWTAGTVVAANLVVRTSLFGTFHDWTVGGPSIGMLASNRTTNPASLTAGEQFAVPHAACPSLGFGLVDFGPIGIPATQIIGFKLCEDTILVGASLHASVTSVTGGTAGSNVPLQLGGGSSPSITVTPTAASFTASLGNFDYAPQLIYGFTASITTLNEASFYTFPSVVVGQLPIPLQVQPAAAAFALPAVYCTYAPAESVFSFYAPGQTCGIGWYSSDGSETGASFTIGNSQPTVASIVPTVGVLGDKNARGDTIFTVTSLSPGTTQISGMGTDAMGRHFSNAPLVVNVTNGVRSQQHLRSTGAAPPRESADTSAPRILTGPGGSAARPATRE